MNPAQRYSNLVRIINHHCNYKKINNAHFYVVEYADCKTEDKNKRIKIFF